MNWRSERATPADAVERALAAGVSADRGLLDRDVADLVELAQALDASAARITPSPAFRARARQRLLADMARGSAVARSSGTSLGDRVRTWLARLAAGLAALGVAGGAVATASASALPGDFLYPVKQTAEAVGVQVSPSGSAREQVVVRQVDARLDETARLLEQGRTAESLATVQRYDDTLDALQTLTGTASATSPSTAVEAHLRHNAERLSALLESAPAAARPGLERALAATERHLPAASARPARLPVSDDARPPVSPTDDAARREPMPPADADDRARAEPRADRPSTDPGRQHSQHSRNVPPATDDGDVPPTQSRPVEPDVDTRKAHGEAAPVDAHAGAGVTGESRPAHPAQPAVRPSGRGAAAERGQGRR